MNWEQHKEFPQTLYVPCCAWSLQLRPTLRNPVDSSVHGLLCPRESPGKNPGVGCHFLLQRTFPTQESNPGQVDSLLYKPPGKTNNTGVGSLPLLEGNFSTEESNWGFLHFRRILYQLSYPSLLNFTIKLFDFYSLVRLSFLKSVL